MARRRKVDLTPEQRAELKRAKRRHPKPYIRECASGILKALFIGFKELQAQQGAREAGLYPAVGHYGQIRN